MLLEIPFSILKKFCHRVCYKVKWYENRLEWILPTNKRIAIDVISFSHFRGEKKLARNNFLTLLRTQWGKVLKVTTLIETDEELNRKKLAIINDNIHSDKEKHEDRYYADADFRYA